MPRFEADVAWDAVCRTLYRTALRTNTDVGDPLTGNAFIAYAGAKRRGDHLSRYLRAQGAEVTIAPNAAEFVQGLRAGRFDIGVTERLSAGQIAAREGWSVEWAPPELPRYPVVLGLWKGDLTLKRAIVDGLETLAREGEVAKIIARYTGDGRAAQRAGFFQTSSAENNP